MTLSERAKCFLAEKFGLIVYCHDSPERHKKRLRVNAVKQERDLLLTHVEAEQLINCVEAVAHMAGHLAEVGTYRGASARLIRSSASLEKILHVFDTFAGLPEPGTRDAAFRRGEFAVSLNEVQSYLGNSGIAYHVGKFPDSVTPEISALQYSFVHLDVDLYEGTLECLRFFWPRLTRGGILLSHDYGCERAPGVYLAFEQYFEDKATPIVQLSGYQGMVVKG